MREFSEQTLTEEVIKRVAATPDPRLREIMTGLIKHLHGFVHEVRPTWDEWFAGIQFLTAVGQKCDDKRQEFILLSDTLGVSMLVDLINYGKVEHATESTVLGPFYVEEAPELPLGSNIARHASDGEPCVVTGSVASLNGTSIPGAVLDVWQAGGDGFYDVQKPDGTNLRARFQTNARGEFWFRAVRPSSYPVPTDGPVGEMLQTTGRHAMRPGHLHFMVSAPGHERLVTHLFVKGDPYLESDAVFAVKESLVVDCERIASRQEAAKYQVAAPFYRLHYDFVLKPARV
jgi:protocatechuate 3,4-dioxygenase beta subunit